jgi:hypothetical protein
MRFLRFLAVILFCAVGSCLALPTQAASPVQATSPAPASHYADEAYLCADRYSNAYFGFSFELPPAAHLRPVAQPVSSDGSVQLLELGGPPPADAQISIVAYPAGSHKGDPKTLLRKALDQELFTGVEELRGLSRTTFGGHSFFVFETRRGIEQHMFLASEMNGYVVRVVLAAHDERILKQMELGFEHLQFFVPSQLRQYVDADAKLYEGPAMSAHRLDSLRADPPANHMPLGEVDSTVYHNASLGFSYRFPEGWSVEPEGAVEPALAKPKARDELLLDGSKRAGGGTERQLMQVCSRTLFSAWAKHPGPDGLLTYDDFGEVTISAIADGCFPGLAFPTNAKDQQGFKNFIAELGFTHPVLHDMRDAKVLDSNGSIFLLLRGVLAMQIRDEALSRRVSVAMAVTRRRGYLLLMFFAAPHDSELQPLLERRVSFDSEPRSGVAVAGKGGGETTTHAAVASAADDATSPVASTAEQQTAAGVPPPQDTSSTAGAASSTANSPVTAAGNTNGDATAEQQDSATGSRPTLLRPGENMQDQQVKGAPIPRH